MMWSLVKGYALVAVISLVLSSQADNIYPLCVWNMQDESLSRVQGFTYKYSIDGGPETTFPSTKCYGEGGTNGIDVAMFTCEAILPYTILGEHTIYLVAANSQGSSRSESTKFILDAIGIGGPNRVVIK